MRPSCMRVIFASGSLGLAHSALLSRLPLRCRSSCLSSAAVGVGTPLSCAIRVSICAVALAGVAPPDRAHRRVRRHGRGIDPDPLALDQPALGQLLQHPGEHLLVHLERQPRPGPAQPGMVGHPLPQLQPEEIAQRQAVGAAPLQARARWRCPRSSPTRCIRK